MRKAQQAFLVGVSVFVGSACATTNPRPFDCAAPPANLKGVVKVKDPIPGRYVVVLKPPAVGTRAVADVRSFAASYAELRDVVVFSHVLSGFSASMDKSVAKRMAQKPEVAFVQEDGRKTVGPRVAPQATATWGLDRTDQRDLPLTASTSRGPRVRASTPTSSTPASTARTPSSRGAWVRVSPRSPAAPPTTKVTAPTSRARLAGPSSASPRPSRCTPCACCRTAAAPTRT